MYESTVLLTSVHGSFAARVLAARLADEGIDSRLRGPLDSPYRFTVGDFAKIDVYVPTDQVADASYVLLAGAVDEATELPEPRTVTAWLRWPALALLVAVVAVAVAPIARTLG